MKDRTGASGEDCAWLDEVLWQVDQVIISANETGMKELIIPRGWIEQELVGRYGSDRTGEFRRRFGNDYDVAVRKPSGKTSGEQRMFVWQDYVMGTDPTDTNSIFRTSIKMVNGVPNLGWDPNLGSDRVYRVWGRGSLNDDVGWICPTNALHRFFKVTVEMP